MAHITHLLLTPVTVSTSTLEVSVNDNEAEEDLKSILICRRYLLEAGSDPTIPVLYKGYEEGNAFRDCLDNCVPVCSSFCPLPFP